MSLWRQLTRGVRGAHAPGRRRPGRQRRGASTIFEQAVDGARSPRGLSPDEARRAARLELGTAAAVSEQVRVYGWENVVGDIALADLRYAARRLRSEPGLHRRSPS